MVITALLDVLLGKALDAFLLAPRLQKLQYFPVRDAFFFLAQRTFLSCFFLPSAFALHAAPLHISLSARAIVGSSLFNLMTSQSVPAENYPFCTIDPNEAKCAVPDQRFKFLCDLYQPVSKVPR